jgi:hypothetical protein
MRRCKGKAKVVGEKFNGGKREVGSWGEKEGRNKKEKYGGVSELITLGAYCLYLLRIVDLDRLHFMMILAYNTAGEDIFLVSK